MKGIGVGQRPGRVEGIIINLHDQTLLYMQQVWKSVRSRKQVQCRDVSNTYG